MKRKNEKGARAQVHIVVPEEDKRLWKETADLLGISLSDYVRKSVRSSRIQFSVQPKVDIRGLSEVIAQYGKIGSNINQIARHLNEGRGWSDHLILELQKCLSDMDACSVLLKETVERINGDYQT